MSQSSDPEPKKEINISDANIEKVLIGQAGRDLTQIQIITYLQTKIIQVLRQEIKERELLATSPYKGLRKFEPEDRAKFFGREQFLTGLINDLEQSDRILLLGASGSGKSSVVRAGLIPWLSEKWGTKFVNLIFTPDEDPFESLHASLLGKYKQSEVKFALQATAKTLSQVVTTLKQSEDYWLIFIDQFEELFTRSSEHQRNLFIDSLVQLMKAKNSNVKLIFTMRADFLDRIGAYPTLGKLTQNHIRLMIDMQRDELRHAIEQPAIHHGVVFEDGLVEEIVKDVQGQAGYLPLLQYTLDLFWETESDKGAFADRTLSIDTYRQLGGARGALQQRVNLFYNALPETEQMAVQRIMLKLVDIAGEEASGAEWKPVRRRAQRSEFSDRLEQQVLMELIDRNLLISNLQPSSQVATVEIAHEVLLTSWANLHDWIQSNRQAIALRNRLNEDVSRWQVKKVEDELWSGSKLEQVLELRKNLTFNQVLGGFTQEANRFIDDSLGRRDRQRRRTNIVLASFSSLLVIVAGFALRGWQQTALEQIKSLTQSSVALFISHREIDALVEALKAGDRLKSVVWSDADTQNQVQLALQHAVYKIIERNRLEGHNNSVRSVSFSPNGRFIATASEDSTVRLWNNAGKERHRFTVQNQLFRTVTFNSDSTMIAAISADNTIKVWGVDGREVATEKGQDREDNFMSGICFVPRTNIVAASGSGKTVNLWRINGQNLQLIKPLTGHKNSVWSISCSNDGKIVTADQSGYLGLWSQDGTELKKPFNVSKQSIYGVSFSPNGQTIAIAGGDTIIRLWNIDRPGIKIIGKHNNQATSVSFSRDGQQIASTSMDNTVKLWSREGKELKTLEGHGDRVYSSSFSKDGNTLASASDDNTVKLWSMGDRESKTLFGHLDSLYAVSFSPKGEIIASAGDGEFKKNTDIIGLWNADGQERQPFKANSDLEWNRIWSLSFSADGKTIATANSDRTIVLWNLNGEKLKTIKGHDSKVGEVIDVKFSPTDPLIASASYDGTVKLWDLDGKCLKTFNGKAGKVRSVSFSHDGKIIASAHNDGTIKLWNLAEKEDREPRTLKGHTAYATDVSFSPDGKIIASAGKDKIIKLWNLEGQELKTLAGHTGAVNRISFKEQDSNMLASASTDGTIRIWDLTNGREIKTLKRKGVGYPFWNVRFSPDGKKVVSVSDDALVELWNAETQDSQQLISQGCKWLDDYLKNNNNSNKNQYICDKIK
jgi:WD40 repeat protein/ABC-type dipeptide/oligopeptide/nickel transport system ATPase component